MNDKLTELVFILDRSGSMGGLESDTIGGFNSMLEKQRNVDGEAVVTTVLFDDRYELLHDRIPIAGVLPMTDRQYFVRGGTALLDAVGRTIAKISRAWQNTAPAQRPGKVIFVITTDGQENASREFSRAQVRQMITERQNQGWEFTFLGANMDAVEEARSLGISADRAATYRCDSRGTAVNFAAVGEFLRKARTGPERADGSWKAPIEADCAGRGRPKDTGEGKRTGKKQ